MTCESGGVRSRAVSAPSIATIVAVFVVALLCLTLSMNRTVSLVDEGITLTGSIEVLDGRVLHRDFFSLYGPGQPYVLAALYRLFGVSVLVERAWDTIVRCATVVLVLLVVGQVAPRWIAFLVAIATALSLASLGFYGYAIFPALAAALASLALLVPAFGVGGPASRLAASGLCSGLVVLFRYDVGIGTFGAECVVLALSVWFESVGRPSRLRLVLRTVVWFGGGFAVVVVPVAIAYALYGVIPGLIFDFFTYPAQYYVKMRSLPFPRFWVLRAYPANFIGVYLPLVVCVAAVPAMVAVVRHRWDDDTRRARPDSRTALPWTWLALFALTLIFFVKGLVRVSTIHLAMALITALALAGVLAQPVPQRGLIGRLMAAGALLAAALFTLFSLGTDLHFAADNIAWASHPAAWELPAGDMPPPSGTCRMPAGLQRMACFPMSAETFETIRYVQQRTTADDPVFVGVPRNDIVFANAVLLYFAMDRRPATKWYEFDPGLQTTAAIQQDIIGDLQRTRPKLIVLDASWVGVREPNASGRSSGVTLLDDYIRRTFEPAAAFGPYTILRPRSPAQS